MCEFNKKFRIIFYAASFFYISVIVVQTTIVTIANKENIRHLIFECDIEIWWELSTILQFDIMWKHIILCFYKENNCKVLTLNNIISYVSYRIYRFKMLCTFKKKNENCQSLREYVRKYLITNINYLIMHIKSSKYIIKLKCLANILLMLLYTLCTYVLPTCMCATLGDHVMGCM